LSYTRTWWKFNVPQIGSKNYKPQLIISPFLRRHPGLASSELARSGQALCTSESHGCAASATICSLFVTSNATSALHLHTLFDKD
jgi:hypothetical protein